MVSWVIVVIGEWRAGIFRVSSVSSGVGAGVLVGCVDVSSGVATGGSLGGEAIAGGGSGVVSTASAAGAAAAVASGVLTVVFDGCDPEISQFWRFPLGEELLLAF